MDGSGGVTRLGKHQLQMLIMLASPTCVLLTPGRSEAGLVKRGLLKEREPGRACTITPAGLRALAEAMEAGLIEDAIELMRKQADERKKRREERT